MNISTYGAALNDAIQRFAPLSSSPKLDAQLLLAEVTGNSRAHVIAHPEKHLTPSQVQLYESLVARRAAGEPIAYILGRRAFYDREFSVSPAVLIPRPETEHLLEAALDFVRAVQSPVVVDCGTGSGALAITLAANVPATTVYATDISPDALHIAQQNAQAHGVNVTFLQGDLLQPLIDRDVHVDCVMANLPYIPTDDMHALEVSRYEPHLALDGGPDGLDLVRRLLRQIPTVWNPGGLALLEIGADQGAATVALAAKTLPGAQISIRPDLAGHDRVVQIHNQYA